MLEDRFDGDARRQIAVAVAAGGFLLEAFNFRAVFVASAGGFLALGLLSHTVGWLLITNALPKIRASFSGLILLLQPALAFVWDVFFFHRPTTMLNWLGVLIALAAIYMGMARQSAASH